MDISLETSIIVEDMFQDFSKKGLEFPVRDSGGKAVVGKVNLKARKNLMREAASEVDMMSEHTETQSYKVENQESRGSVKPVDIEREIDDIIIGDKPVTTEETSGESMGFINYIAGRPQVILDDKYLEPFLNDIKLRHEEYRK